MTSWRSICGPRSGKAGNGGIKRSPSTPGIRGFSSRRCLMCWSPTLVRRARGGARWPMPAVEITEPDHPARPIVERYKAEMRRRFRQLAHEMGAREPDSLGDALMLLWEGSYLTLLTLGRHGPVEGAAKAQRAVIAAYTD